MFARIWSLAFLAMLFLVDCKSRNQQSSQTKESLGVVNNEFVATCGLNESHFAKAQAKNPGTFALRSPTQRVAQLIREETKNIFNSSEHKCANCHVAGKTADGAAGFLSQSDGNPIVPNVDFMIQNNIIDLAKPENSLLLKKVSGTAPAMPMGADSKPLNQDEVETLKTWIEDIAYARQDGNGVASDQAPSYFSRISEADVLACIVKDLREHVTKSHRPFIRYFSLAHLINAAESEQVIQVYRDGLTKLVNSLSTERSLRRPFAIDTRTKVIFRIDLRSYGWDTALWDAIASASPYAKTYSDAEYQTAATFMSTRVSYLRADWFVATASRPPLYYNILLRNRSGNPVGDLVELEDFVGVNRQVNIQNGVAARVAVQKGEPSSNGVNRVIERHKPSRLSPFGYYWISYDFENVIQSNLNDLRNAFRFPLGPCFRVPFSLSGNPDANNCTDALHLQNRQFKEDGTEIIFQLPNGLNGYFIANSQGQRLDSAPIELVSHTDINGLTTDQSFGLQGQALDNELVRVKTISSGYSCMRCHVQGIIEKQNDLSTSPGELARLRIQPNLHEKIKELYKDSQTMHTTYFTKDIESYTGALKSLDLNDRPTKDNEPVYKSVLLYERPINIATLMAENHYFDKEALENVIGQLNNEVINNLLREGRVRRAEIERVFPEIIRQLDLGIPVFSDLQPPPTGNANDRESPNFRSNNNNNSSQPNINNISDPPIDNNNSGQNRGNNNNRNPNEQGTGGGIFLRDEGDSGLP